MTLIFYRRDYIELINADFNDAQFKHLLCYYLSHSNKDLSEYEYGLLQSLLEGRVSKEKVLEELNNENR